MPPEANAEAIDNIGKIPSVKGIYRGDVNLADLSGKLFGDVQALRQSSKPGMEALLKPRSEGFSPVGMRIIAVWNQSVGVGKIKVSTNLANETARRGLPSLLIGLIVPTAWNVALVQQLVARTDGLGFLNKLLPPEAMLFLKLL